MSDRETLQVLGANIDVLTWSIAVQRLLAWAQCRESRYVCACSVHSVVTATYDQRFQSVVNAADMATPDGGPVAWLLRKLGAVGQERINGPDLMWTFCEAAQAHGISVFFYGNTDDTLQKLEGSLRVAYPNLRIAGCYSPPFRPLTAEEDEAIVMRINASGAGMLFVGLGCPKQELWMAEHKGRIHAVMMGVGAAFDFHAGTLKRAPRWMQEHYLEWVHRLLSEPRRLWRRYLVTNSLFIWGAFWQLFKRAWAR